jgi:gas vesicle protein
MTTDDVLARLGLHTRMKTTDYMLPALGLFGAGLVVGAGLGLLFAPRPGHEMRAEIGRRAGNMRMRMPFRRGKGSGALEQMTREELYEIAKEHEIEGRGSMSRDELIDAVSGLENH